MRIVNFVKHTLLCYCESEEEDLFVKFSSNEEREYIKNYFKNENDCHPLTKVDDKFRQQFEDIKDIVNDQNNGFNLLKQFVDRNPNNSMAVFYLGQDYCLGDGVERNDKKGIELISKACCMENPYAQWFLGYLYETGIYNGMGNPIELERNLGYSIEDRDFAYFWEYRAAMNGHKKAQFFFADNMACGRFDTYYFDDELLKLEIISANQNFRPAQEHVIRILLNDEGEFYNKDKGIEYAKKYIDSGNIDIEDILRRYNIILD